MTSIRDSRRASALPLPEALRQLSSLLLSTDGFTDLLTQVATLAVRSVPAAVACGITVSTSDDRLYSAATSDAFAAHLDEQQYDLDDGPCVQALLSGEVVSVDDLALESRWGNFAPRALAAGVHSVYAEPIDSPEAGTVGVLNLYATSVGAFDADSRAAAHDLSRLAALTVVTALRSLARSDVNDQLREALSNRAAIDQAIGVLMATQRCSAKEAFGILRRSSQTQSKRLTLVAAELVAWASTTPDDPHTR